MNCLNKCVLILEFSKEDMSKSLLHMISNDIGQLACLYAKLHNLSRVYFGGFFIRGHPVTMHTITYSINFFTKARFSPSPDKKGFVSLWHWPMLVYMVLLPNLCFSFDSLFGGTRVKFRPCSSGMKVTWEPLERSS